MGGVVVFVAFMREIESSKEDNVAWSDMVLYNVVFFSFFLMI